MKKVGGLVALLTCVTIGGVYATWTYSETTNIIDQTAKVFVEMTDAVDDGANGTYTVETNFKLIVDQMDADHTAGLKFVKPGTVEALGTAPTITFTFKPSLGATQKIKEEGVLSYYYVSTSIAMQFECDANGVYKPVTEGGAKKDIFDVKVQPTNKVTIGTSNSSEEVKWERSAEKVDGLYVFTYTITGEENVKALFDLNNFKLDSLTAYNAFKSQLTGNIVIHVTDGTPDTAQNSNN